MFFSQLQKTSFWSEYQTQMKSSVVSLYKYIGLMFGSIIILLGYMVYHKSYAIIIGDLNKIQFDLCCFPLQMECIKQILGEDSC